MNQNLAEQPGCLGFLAKLLGRRAVEDAEVGDAEGPWPYAKKGYVLSKGEYSFFRVL